MTVLTSEGIQVDTTVETFEHYAHETYRYCPRVGRTHRLVVHRW